MNRNGYTLVQLLTGIVVTVIVLGATLATLQFFVRSNRKLLDRTELLDIQNDALDRIDCERSLATPCRPRDKNGNDWPNVNGRLGRWDLTSSCGSQGLTISKRPTPDEGQAPESWELLFKDTAFFCPATSTATTGPISPLPYHQIATAVGTGVYGCYYADGGANGYRGYSFYGIAWCPIGYTAVSGGHNCGSDTTQITTNWPSLTYFASSPPYSGWAGGCCAPYRSTVTYYAVCIRN